VPYQSPYVSICIPAYNMKDYLEKAIISILNQSFQNFEIIIVNDHSNDETLKVIKKLQLKDGRIKLINHLKNSGVYTSRVDSILASKGKFLILNGFG
jgi:glycosyltransferase involved in cell wall biosynthesis